MPRSDEAEWWFNAVYEAVQGIPHGRVTSYGHIARLLGRRESIARVNTSTQAKVNAQRSVQGRHEKALNSCFLGVEKLIGRWESP